MTALRYNPSRSISTPGLLLTVCSTLLFGCLGGSGGGPKLGWQDEDTVTLTLSAADSKADQAVESDEDPAVADAGTADEAAASDEEAKRPEAQRRTTADDSVRCGDGKLDDDEICDIAIADGEEGACPTDCGKDPCAKLDVHGCMTSCMDDTTKPECVQTDAGMPSE